jgi:hypothetical protein
VVELVVEPMAVELVVEPMTVAAELQHFIKYKFKNKNN